MTTSTTPSDTTKGPDVIKPPNVYELHGDGIIVTYSASDLKGQPELTYHSESLACSFSGPDVTVEETQVGTLVSVTIVKTVDVGFTSFTLVLPYVNLVFGDPATIRTVGITTLHRALAGAIGHPQQTTYRVQHLHGSARQVQSLS